MPPKATKPPTGRKDPPELGMSSPSLISLASVGHQPPKPTVAESLFEPLSSNRAGDQLVPLGRSQTQKLSMKALNMIAAHCHLHQEPADYFCETCEELCCETCFLSGYHSNPVHIGRPIEAILRERTEKMQHNINRVMRIKEMDLNEKLRRLDRSYVQMKYVSNYYQNATQHFFEAMVQQLRVTQDKEIAAVSKCLGGIQADIHRINSIIGEANSLVVQNQVIGFLDAYPKLMKQAEHMYFKKHPGRYDLTQMLLS